MNLEFFFMNQNKELKLDYSYDIDVDAMFINVVNDYVYDKSIEFEFGLILDFDTEGIPVALEMLDISQLFDSDRNFFNKIENIEMKIKINCCISLDLKIYLLMGNKLVKYDLNKMAVNYLNSPKKTYLYSLK